MARLTLLLTMYKAYREKLEGKQSAMIHVDATPQELSIRRPRKKLGLQVTTTDHAKYLFFHYERPKQQTSPLKQVQFFPQKCFSQ